jgi:UPF0755 protein
MKKKLIYICFFILLVGGVLVYRGIYSLTGNVDGSVVVSILPGMTVQEMGDLLEEQRVVYSGNVLGKYLAWKKLDTHVQHGDVTFNPPHTIANVANTLTTRQSAAEREITILPGWNLNDIAEYFKEENITKSTEFFDIVGYPTTFSYEEVIDFGTEKQSSLLKGKPTKVSLEGYLRPDTYRIFLSSSIVEIVEKLILARQEQFTEQMFQDLQKQQRSVHDVLTMASILEREVRTPEDRRFVSDLFWRRHDVGMALQADSTVHYIAGTDGSVFTSKKDREIDSLWNTYKYPGLPPGPISNPSLDSIMAAIYPEHNEYWYFLTTLDTGEVKYAKTLEGHNKNVAMYLR